MADKCPKCGAKRDGIHGRPHYLCGSWNEGHGLEQSEECKLRVELVELMVRHQRLVEAADKIAQLALPVHGQPSFFVSEGMINALKKALESEPANNQKPADQGCPFDEALESEVKP